MSGYGQSWTSLCIWRDGRGAGSGRSGVKEVVGRRPRGRAPHRKAASDAAALGRADAIVGDRRNVADRPDAEHNDLQRAPHRFEARDRAADVEGKNVYVRLVLAAL